MKKVVLLFILFFVSFSIFSSVSPLSGRIGKVCVSPQKGSAEEMVTKAMKSEYTDYWLEKYAHNPITFALLYSEVISSIIPMDNFILSYLDKSEVKILNLDTKQVINIKIEEGKILALLID